MKIINKKHRRVLSEGRNYQMGFAFAKNNKDSLETVQPISPCKDYLNDVVYSENTGNPCSAYGLSYRKKDILSDINYLIIKICGSGASETKYDNYDIDVKRLNDNYKKLEYFIQYFDILFNNDYKTTINLSEEENTYYVSIDRKWCNGTYSISLLSLLLRVGQFYTSGDPLEYLKTFNDFTSDVYLVNKAMINIDKLIKMKKLPVQDMSNDSSGCSVHNNGICSVDVNMFLEKSN